MDLVQHFGDPSHVLFKRKDKPARGALLLFPLCIGGAKRTELLMVGNDFRNWTIYGSLRVCVYGSGQCHRTVVSRHCLNG